MDGISFHSKVEAQRYVELRAREEAGYISSLHTQHKFPLEVGGMKVCDYIADFTYYKDGEFVVEDVKGGAVLPDFTIKKKLMKAVHNIDVRIVRKRSRKGTGVWEVDDRIEEQRLLPIRNDVGS